MPLATTLWKPLVGPSFDRTNVVCWDTTTREPAP